MPESKPDVPPAFTIERADAPAGAAVLVVTGELDLATSGRFRSHIEEAIASGMRVLVVDFTEVTFMESTMLRELLRARDDVVATGAELVIAGAGTSVRRLLDLTGTTGLFSFAQSRSDALAALERGN